MYRSKSLDKIIGFIGKELYTLCANDNKEHITIGLHDKCYPLSEYIEEYTDCYGNKHEVKTIMYTDGSSVMYLGDGCSYAYGSLSELIKYMDGINFHSKASDALRDYFHAYEAIKEIAKEEK